ncbi:NINE protein [Ideonella sp. A 288]|uniref:NINE protein n=1 Tax=Ideonella sp. A 288 TaxID=1962181 RepID=UPI001F35CD9C|nr:NINE protein [Ideonella sp. A 288]
MPTPANDPSSTLVHDLHEARGGSPGRPPRSKTLATWLALLLGSLGAHRFYLHGRRDLWAWLHPMPTLLGLAGVIRMRTLGQDDHAAWLLIPVLGVMLSIAMLAAIVIGLTPDERWAARFSPGVPMRPSGWAAVIGVVVALMLGGGVLMGTLAFGGQKYFEYQTERRQG